MKIVLPQSSDPVASIIIAVSSSPQLLLSCLRSLEAFAPRDLGFETIVVLNAPDEPILQTDVCGVQFINSPLNLGVAGGCNLGRSTARGEHIVILHDDAEVEPGWLESLIATAAAHPEAGAIGSMVLSLDGQLRNAGMILWQDASTTSAWMGHAPSPSVFSTSRPVDYCGTSSLLVRASAWDAVGGFDEEFFPAYYVDVDLCMGLRRLGYSILFEPASRIRHRGGASSGALLKAFAGQRNRKLFVSKWHEALQDHEPIDAASPAAALDRAKARAASHAANLVAPTPARSCSALFDAEIQVGRQSKRIGQFYRAFAAFIEERAEPSPSGSSIPTYALGTELSFASRGNAYCHVVAGQFHEPEDWGVWTKHTLRLLLPLDCDSVQSTLELRLVAMHLISPRRPISVFRLEVGGATACEISETRPDLQLYVIPIEAEAVVAACLILDVVCDRLVSPAEVDYNGDVRPLGVGLKSLTVVSTSPHSHVAKEEND